MLKNPINVIHIMPQVGTGGAEHQLLELIRGSDPDMVRHRVIYYSESYDTSMLDRYRSQGVSLECIERNSKRPVRFLRDLSSAIRQAQPDIVHCWLVSGNFWGRIAGIMAGIKVIILAWRSSRVWNAKGLWLLERFTKNRVCHLANSYACAGLVARAIGVLPETFEVIYNGINLEKYRQTKDRRSVFAGLTIPDNVKIATMVGRLTEAKNYPMLLRTAKRCREQNLPVHFVIVGHGERETELKALAEELNVAETVHFLGLRTDVPQVLAASDLFLYTSNWEGFPNALLEAMATGLPVITTDFDGVKELVTGPDVGTIVPLNDAEAATKAIENNLKDSQAVGRNAQLLVQSSFAMPVMVKKTIELYKKLANR